MTFNPARAILAMGVALVCPLIPTDARDGVVPDTHQIIGTAPTTLTTLPLDSEGLTVDPATRILYTAEAPDASGECFVRSITLSGVVSLVGTVPKPAGPCAPRGLEFRGGRLYIADQGAGATGWVFEMDPVTGQAIVFAAGVPGANGIVFDSRGNLWITDSLRGFGRVYRREAATGVVEEVFRVPPVGNGTTYGGRMSVPNASGIGRQIVNLPVGMQAEVRQVANGIAVVERYRRCRACIGPGAASSDHAVRRRHRQGRHLGGPARRARRPRRRVRPVAIRRCRTTRCAKTPCSWRTLGWKARTACSLTPMERSGSRQMPGRPSLPSIGRDT